MGVGRPADLSESAPESDWIAMGYRRATRADYDASPDTVLDVVIDEHYGLVDFDRRRYWLTDIHIVSTKAGASMTAICAAIVDPEPVSKRCCSCHEEKPLTEFSPQACGTHGVSGECKACHSDRVAFEQREGKIAARYDFFESRFEYGERSVSDPRKMWTISEDGCLMLVEVTG